MNLKATAFDSPQGQCIHQIFEAQVERTPDAPAVSYKDQRLTYRQLNDRANLLARDLRGRGVGPDVLVGVCLARSVEMVVATLAILKAGGAYLPLDPLYPRERLSFLLEDSDVSLLVTQKHCAANLPHYKREVVYLDSLGSIAEQSGQNLENAASLENLAYVIYTSGSTGTPKGVEITHANLLNLVLWHQTAFQVTVDDRASVLASVGFDAAVWETWPYLGAGASLHLPDEETRLSPERLRDWLVSNEITISFLPTVLAERIMALQWPSSTALRILLTGAEMLHQFPSHDLPFKLVNNYGPTECTVVTSSGLISPAVCSDAAPTIGRPITNTQVYILDEKLQQVPTGAAGELYIGGAGVARGYRHRPDLTLEKFIQDPFSDAPQARLYKTGDVGRYLSNGEIVYVGRMDDQIKIRGYRIEPNEIVAVLDRHPSIAASVLVAREDGNSEKRLVAYVVLNSESEPSADELRKFLGNELPAYMVPAVFVSLDALPLTEHGKVDRHALPAPDSRNTLRDQPFTAPRTPIEQRLAAVLCTLLHLDHVSIHDNFFFLGGHSLLGTQLIAQIRSAFGVEVTLRKLFDTPTIADLSSEIERLILAKIEAMNEDEVQRLLV
ncbi:MAG TPA: amino acid adenylation domain-containing protein [Pyrinomonadaceae bacterium]|jgi:amino acid adenylation domain-containing protein|nr:amino acid adenylation domain-containing protein [Pyrinomonadaceae bacterium]